MGEGGRRTGEGMSLAGVRADVILASMMSFFGLDKFQAI
jgi:hypothetical protein